MSTIKQIAILTLALASAGCYVEYSTMRGMCGEWTTKDGRMWVGCINEVDYETARVACQSLGGTLAGRPNDGEHAYEVATYMGGLVGFSHEARWWISDWPGVTGEGFCPAGGHPGPIWSDGGWFYPDGWFYRLDCEERAPVLCEVPAGGGYHSADGP